MSAAVEAANHGIDVALLDEQEVPGGADISSHGIHPARTRQPARLRILAR